MDYTPESGISSTSNPQFKGGFRKFIDLLINNNGSATLEQISSVASDTYMEIQIHGKENHKMDSDHIREIIFYKTPSSSVIEKLKRAGISWRTLE